MVVQKKKSMPVLKSSVSVFFSIISYEFCIYYSSKITNNLFFSREQQEGNNVSQEWESCDQSYYFIRVRVREGDAYTVQCLNGL